MLACDLVAPLCEPLRAALFLALVTVSVGEMLGALEPSGAAFPDVVGMEQIWPQNDLMQEGANSTGPPRSFLSGERFMPPAPYAQCLRNSGRSCEMVNGSSIVNYQLQCHNTVEMHAGSQASVKESEQCSSSQPGISGTCICTQGWCADGSNRCVNKENDVLPGTYTITTKEYGDTKHLYMAPNGEVRIGSPPDSNQARWRIAKTHDGVHHLYTLAYPQDLLDAWDECGSGKATDPATGAAWETCKSVVGHSAQPPAAETGWYIDSYDVGTQAGTFVILRSKDTNRILYIDAVSLTALSCGSDSLDNCPGNYGALRFDPPLVGVELTTPPVTALYLSVHLGLYVLILLIFAAACLCGGRVDAKTKRHEESQNQDI